MSCQCESNDWKMEPATPLRNGRSDEALRVTFSKWCCSSNPPQGSKLKQFRKAGGASDPAGNDFAPSEEAAQSEHSFATRNTRYTSAHK